MIKIEVSQENLDDIINRHKLYVAQYIKPKIINSILSARFNYWHDGDEYFSLVDNYLEEISVGDPIVIEEFSRKSHPLNVLYASFSDFERELVQKVFDYESFSDGKNVNLLLANRKFNNYYYSDLDSMPQTNIDLRKKLIRCSLCWRFYINSLNSDIERDFIQGLIGFVENLLQKQIYTNPRGKIQEYLRENSKFPWGAYQLVEALDVRTCPFCNRSYVSILRKENGCTRPELDHFFPKSLYPHLSLSLFNLVPSCHVCNSSLKGNIDTASAGQEGINPYVHGFDDHLTFSIGNAESIKIRIDKDSEINITFKSKYESIDVLKRCRRNAEIFHLQHLYNDNHKDVVEELLWKRQEYPEDYIRQLKEISIGLPSDDAFSRLFLGSYSNPKEFNKRPLSKLIYDIAAELGLLKYLK